MTDNMKKFLEAVSKNKELHEKMNTAVKNELMAMAKELGIDLTDADFVQDNELSDDVLGKVSGGSRIVKIYD